MAEKRVRCTAGRKMRASKAAASQDFRAERAIGACASFCGAPRAAAKETNQSVPTRDIRTPSWSHADLPGGLFRTRAGARLPRARSPDGGGISWGCRHGSPRAVWPCCCQSLLPPAARRVRLSANVRGPLCLK